ncbi:co-chaperone DjlA [Shewanella sp. WXL01]|uniref:Co-chaperone protein DjlA n=1 Tax=Shewanella maritima TaxID=2520507 RepID=A0A411PFT5_9GAMM|nr:MULTISPECIES: co-chaperone DjlA [Shewanella]NKF49648.1 co-chaperone DjlA [Shewanella sp. WXL01]QBF82262.1 co-chaperone DjlA [Shewanella maritima]
MQIWGKVFGALIGFMFGRFLGALVGAYLGHQYDKSRFIKQYASRVQHIQSQFSRTTFALLGRIAKANGRVTESDIMVATMLMDQLKLHGQARSDAQQAFRDGKRADFDVKAQLREFHRATQGVNDLRKMFLEIQVQMALHDGELHASELAILRLIADELGLARQLDATIASMQAEHKYHQANRSQSNKMATADAYSILGVKQSDSDQTIKRAYRRLMNEHHPDKLVAKGLPEEMMKLAKDKAQDIQSAYDSVKADRGMR